VFFKARGPLLAQTIEGLLLTGCTFDMNLRGLLKFVSGNLERKTLLFVVVPLIFLAYFGTIAFASFWFPGTYDWRHRAISNLISPWNNPEFHRIPSAGIAASGLLMIPFAGYIKRRVCVASRFGANIGAFAFGSGAIWLVLAALIVSQHRTNSVLPRLHEICARTSAFGLGTGMVVFCSCAIKGYFIPVIGNKTSNPRLLFSWILTTLPPIFGAGLSECLSLATYAHFAWSTAIDNALKNSIAWHLAFWEWVGSAAVFLFLLSSALFLPENTCE
jgi:hypothetical protein